MVPIDNINTRLGDDLKSTLRPGAKVRIAAASFSMFAYQALREELEGIKELQFIFTSPTFVQDSARVKLGQQQRREFFIPKSNREQALYGSEFEIKLRNQLTQKAIARECADWIRRKAKFKSVAAEAHVPQTLAVQNSESENAGYFGVPSFTTAELGYEAGNALGYSIWRNTDAPTVASMITPFNNLWTDRERLVDVTERLCASMETVYQENSPERVYFITLYHLFQDFLQDVNEDVLPKERLNYSKSAVWQMLYNFQDDAATGIINKLETYNGCILADSVGLGKTFTALAVIKYYELRNQSVLVLCPKKLEDNWRTYNSPYSTNILADDRLSYKILAHTDLSRERGFSGSLDLSKINWGSFDLVVIDESHNFRNAVEVDLEPGERMSRYQALLEKVIRAGVETKVLMLSATPVNNRFSDLKNQLALAYEGHAERLEAKLSIDRGIDEIFRRAQTAFNQWSDLGIEDRTTEALLDSLDFDFFELLDSVTIARSRKHIETYYDTKDFGRFPQRLKPISIRAPLTHREDVYEFNEIYTRLSTLQLAVYTPLQYVLASRRQKYEDLYSGEADSGQLLHSGRESGVQALMTTNLLKRLESSVHAFRMTLDKLGKLIDETLSKIDAYLRTGGAGQRDWGDDAFESETEVDEEEGSYGVGRRFRFELADMDVEGWREHLATDRAIVNDLLDAMNLVTPSEDAKLQDLLKQVLAKADRPINGTNRKVLIFTAFADTAEYLFEHLAEAGSGSRDLQTGLVTGRSTNSSLPGTYGYQELLTLFSPRSKQKEQTMPQVAHELDFLIGTDCISEGQNLQDCDFLINYDIHWNPVRIIQRFGRVDRIGSQNESIQLVNYWPDISLDEYINLKDRVENRMVIADLSATGTDNVLTNESADARYRREQLTRLQDEVIDLEEARAGIALTDLGLNDFRMDLVRYVREQGDLTEAPRGLHAVVPADPERGLPPGVVFVLRALHENEALKRQNRLHPYYLVYVNLEGELVTDHTEPKALLDLLRANCSGQNEPIKPVCKTFNARTTDGADMGDYSSLLAKAIEAMVDRKQAKDLDSLFSQDPSTVLTQGFAHLGDFELITFTVVEPTL